MLPTPQRLRPFRPSSPWGKVRIRTAPFSMSRPPETRIAFGVPPIWLRSVAAPRKRHSLKNPEKTRMSARPVMARSFVSSCLSASFPETFSDVPSPRRVRPAMRTSPCSTSITDPVAQGQAPRFPGGCRFARPPFAAVGVDPAFAQLQPAVTVERTPRPSSRGSSSNVGEREHCP